MNKFLDAYKLPKLNQKNISHLNRSITSNEIKAAIVSQQREVMDQTDSLPNSTISLKRN
jgi:hypothetical protein